MKNILITGAAGFIFSHLCRRLVDLDYNVIAIDDLSCGFKHNIVDLQDRSNFHFTIIDTRNFEIMYTYLDSVLHIEKLHLCFAGSARGETYWCQDHPDKAIDVNVNGTISTLKIAKEFNCDHFFFADTSAEYDNVRYIKAMEVVDVESKTVYNYDSTYPTKERNAPNMNTPMGYYAITKMAASQFVRSMSKDFGFGSTLFRYFNVCGPHQNLDRTVPPVMGAFADKMLNNETPIIYGNGSKKRDFIHIDDITDLHVKALEKRCNMKDSITFNAGTGTNYSVFEIYSLVAEYITDSKDEFKWPNIDYLPDLPGQAQITLADISKTSKYFDWTPKKTIKDMIIDTVESIRSSK